MRAAMDAEPREGLIPGEFRIPSAAMKFLGAIGAMLVMAVVIGLGMLMAVGGSPWLLILSLVGFGVAFVRFGCLH